MNKIVNIKTAIVLLIIISTMMTLLVNYACNDINGSQSNDTSDFDQLIVNNGIEMFEEGRDIFRYDTFGDEEFWGDKIKLHKSISQASPRAALALGLKIDLHALPNDLVQALEKGEVDLDDPAVTLELLRLNAVLGVTGFFNDDDKLSSIGIQCALCHSVVDNSFSTQDIPQGNIGQRLDGWANRDLDIGAIVALAPDLSLFANLLNVDEQTVRTVLNSWGPGKFDAEIFMDGVAFRPDGKSAATLIPPAYGLAGINLHTWTGWGSVTHWNAFVANLEMHGKGTFFDPRLNDPERFPIAAREGFGNVRSNPDLITSKLAALQFYQLAIPSPASPEETFNKKAASRGEVIFNGKADCSSCHVPPLYTEPGWNMHTPEEIGIDDFQANRSPDRHYRTPPLKGIWAHEKGGFYHDGRFKSLAEVVEHYNDFFELKLTEKEKYDLIQFLYSL